MDCEICGLKSAVMRVKIDSVVMQVCHACESTGKPVFTEKTPEKYVAEFRKPNAEEVLVADYAKIISSARQKLNLKQEELATKLNEKLSVIHAAEQGKRCDIKLAKKLERFFRIKLVGLV